MQKIHLPGPRAKSLIDRDKNAISASNPRVYPFVMDQITREPFTQFSNRVEYLSFEYFLLTPGCGKSAIRFAQPLSISKADGDEDIKIFDKVISENGKGSLESGRRVISSVISRRSIK